MIGVTNGIDDAVKDLRVARGVLCVTSIDEISANKEDAEWLLLGVLERITAAIKRMEMMLESA